MKLLILISFFIFQATWAKSKIIVGVSPQCPYVCQLEKGVDGYMIHILNQAFGKKNIEYKLVPKARLKYGLIEKSYQYAIMPSLDIIREPNIFMTSPPLGFHFIGKAVGDKNLLNKPLSKIRNKSLIFIRGSESSKIIDYKLSQYENWSQNKVNFLAGEHISKRMIQMLNLKRVDMVFADYNSLAYQLAKQKKKYFLKATSLVGFTPLILVTMEKRNEKVFKALSDWIKTNRRNGKLKRLLKQYNIEDWEIYDTRF